MRFMKIRSIRTRIMLIILPMIILAMTALSALSYWNAKSLINREIDRKMQSQLSAVTEHIQTQLMAHQKIPETLARAVEAAGDHIEQEVLIDMIMKNLSTNEDTFGIGVWFEPKQYKKYMDYFGPYAYRFNGQIQYTLDYSTKEYDYFNRDFYKIGKNTDQQVVWTDPYYDENSKSAVLTTTAPFYTYNKQFKGVVTANINLDNLQKTVSAVQVGEMGRAFLVDRHGTYIADRQADKMLKMKIADDPNRSLAAIGKAMTASPSGYGVFEDENGKERLYYAEVPATGWKIALSIPEKELYQPLNQLLIRSLITIVVTILILAFVIYAFARYMRRQINQVKDLSSAMASGDFTRSIDIRTEDEFGSMAADLNRMTRELGGLIKKLAASAELVASTSEQLTEGAEQTSRATEEIAESIQAVAAGSETQVTRMNEANGRAEDTSLGLSKISRRISSVSELSKDTLAAALEGNGTLQIAVEQIQVMDEKVRDVAVIIESLNAKSQQIDETMELIGHIAFQTRILALNAGITASQAGSHGKSFNVIAEEIRKLAENATQAGNQIQETVGEIRDQIQTAKLLMDGNRAAISDGKTKIEFAGLSFERIVSAVQEVTQESQSVSEAVGQINGNMRNMLEAIRQIAEISLGNAQRTGTVSASTEEQMASMQEISASASALESLARELKEAVRHFKV